MRCRPPTLTLPIAPPALASLTRAMGRCARGGGFSLVEAVMASLIVGVLAVSALQTVGAAVSARRSHAAMRTGDLLARALMDEVTQTSYAEPDSTPAWGREGAGEASRAAWDDVDDYDGLMEITLTAKDGGAVPRSAGWVRTVTVERLGSSDLVAVAAMSNTGLKRITVSVWSPSGVETKLVALRASGGAHDQKMTGGTSAVTWAGVSLKIGEDGGVVSSGVSLLNRPAP